MAIVEQCLQDGALRVQRLLLTLTAHQRLLDHLAEIDPQNILVARRSVLRAASGFDFHQGCVGLIEAPTPPADAERWRDAPSARLLVIEDVTDPDNVGGLFRNAFAFGVQAVLLSPRCASPLYRKALRTSLGAALRVPFVHAPDRTRFWEQLDRWRSLGVELAGLTPSARNSLSDFLRQRGSLPTRVAVCVGNEGAGLSQELLRRSAHEWRISMVDQANSVNVAAAAAIVLARMFELDAGSDRVARGADTQQ